MFTESPLMRRFVLVRYADESGVSGDGIVAGGVCWPDGTACLRWFTSATSVAVYASMGDVEKIHGHGGKTVVAWLDPNEPQRSACLMCGGGYVGNFCTDCGAGGYTLALPKSLADEIVSWRRRAIDAERLVRGEP